MTTLTLSNDITASSVEISEDTLKVTLDDGRSVSVPISWYPRLSHAKPEDRLVWEFIGKGHGIHWPKLDEDISVQNLLFGQPSGEGSSSFLRWKEWYKNACDKTSE
jgi:hypothetical protein